MDSATIQIATCHGSWSVLDKIEMIISVNKFYRVNENLTQFLVSFLFFLFIFKGHLLRFLFKWGIITLHVARPLPLQHKCWIMAFGFRVLLLPRRSLPLIPRTCRGFYAHKLDKGVERMVLLFVRRREALE
jgi:hypothetical protein